MSDSTERLSRRDLFKASALGAAGIAGAAALAKIAGASQLAQPHGQHQSPQSEAESGHSAEVHMAQSGAVGRVDHAKNGFDPNKILHDFDYGELSQLPNGQALRKFQIFIDEFHLVEIAPNLYFPAWSFNKRIPGPTLRCIEGERVQIQFVNTGLHPHTIHFHGIHSAKMDGIPGVGAGLIQPGGSTIYEFDAKPFGCHLFHCHAMPLKRHIHKGLYGTFIIDPDPNKYVGIEREAAMSRNHQYPENKNVHEMIMMMNAFDTNFDGENEVYAVNTVAFEYMHSPIPVRKDQLQRLYLINITEFDPINSFHLHANFFDYYDHGTTLTPTLKMVDTIMQCQAQRGILEFTFKDFEPGLYMFHAHQSEFAELGWMGFFDVKEQP